MIYRVLFLDVFAEWYLLEEDLLLDAEASLTLTAGDVEEAVGVLHKAAVAREQVVEVVEVEREHFCAVFEQFH